MIVPTRLIMVGVVFVALIGFIFGAVTLSSGGDGERGNAEDAVGNTPGEEATPNTTGRDATPNAPRGDIEGALSNMTIQPNDLPSGFELQEERFYTRDELLQEVPTLTTQVAEEGLKYALHRTFVKEDDNYPEKVDVFTYVYEDARAATAAHEYVQAEGSGREAVLRGGFPLGAIATRLNGGLEPHYWTASFSGSTEGLGEGSVSYDVVINTQSPTPIHALVFGMRHANVRAEVAAVMRANPYLLPDDVARSQLLRIERGSLTSTVD